MHSSPNSLRADVAAPVVQVAPREADPAVVARIVAALKAGGVVGMPTDTVYGLLASVNRTDALLRLARIKRRSAAKPFVVLAADWLAVRQVTSHLPPEARLLGSRHWPGPLTIVLPAVRGLPAEVLGIGAGGTVAVRIPDDPLLFAVLRELRSTIAAPSANRSGEAPATSVDDVLRVFGDELDLVVDGGPARGTKPSTLVRCIGHGVHVLREGPVVIEPEAMQS